MENPAVILPDTTTQGLLVVSNKKCIQFNFSAFAQVKGLGPLGFLRFRGSGFRVPELGAFFFFFNFEAPHSGI